MKKNLLVMGITVILMGFLVIGTAAEEKQPTIVTTLPTDTITEDTAILRGSYKKGSEDVIERGFLYKPILTTDDDDHKYVTVPGDNNVGRFGYTLRKLSPSTQYIARAYVKVGSGLIEGEEVIFETAPTPVTEEITPDTGIVEDIVSAEVPTFLILIMGLAFAVLIRNQKI
ncbi:MAG: hypothetical protein RR335_03800 [Eubacterium sp.]